jgi:hypothetical protein
MTIAMLSMGLAGAPQANAQVNGAPQVFIHIESRAALSPGAIAAARAELAHVFEAARIHLESTAEADHERCGLQFTVHVVLLGGTTADRFLRDEQVGRKVLAQANREARRVYVFWDRVAASGDHEGVARGDALGVVISHELGHVLLPVRGHSKMGIMQENYNPWHLYDAKFTQEQSAAMRALLQSVQKNENAPARGDRADVTQ